MTLNII